MAKTRCLLIMFLVMLSGLLPCGAWAYGEDVHFNLTYVLCRLAGLEKKDALWIADANQSMDNNSSTTAYEFKSIFNRGPYDNNGRHFHDLRDENKVNDTDVPSILGLITIRYSDGGRAARDASRDQLRKLLERSQEVTNDENHRITADIAFGQYLHAEQDYFSHRQFTRDYLVPSNSDDADSSAGNFLPYGPHVGHAHDGDGHSADYVVLRPGLARLMVQDCYRKICQFAGKPAENIPASLNALVDALASTYTMYREEAVTRGKNTYIKLIQIQQLPPGADVDLGVIRNIKIVAPGSQSKINKALSAVLASTETLPEYEESYALSYDAYKDDKKISLDEVKQRVEVGLGKMKPDKPQLTKFPLQASINSGTASTVNWSFKLKKPDGTETEGLSPLSLSSEDCVDKAYPLIVDLKAMGLEGDLTITAQADIDGKPKSDSVTIHLTETKKYLFEDVLTPGFKANIR